MVDSFSGLPQLCCSKTLPATLWNACSVFAIEDCKKLLSVMGGLKLLALRFKEIEQLYRSMRLIRRVEEEIALIYPSDKIKSPIHLSIGQEAISSGVCAALSSDDVISASYRCHAAYLAHGGSLEGMLAELFGKSTGVAGGKAGSMHLIDTSHNILGASAVVGTTIPVALGYAMAMQREGKGRVVVAFFGDGATEEGVFAECLNFASLKKLPILFVCENNGYAINTPTSKRWATDRLIERVATYGIPATLIEDGDVIKTYEATVDALSAIRNRQGPAFFECKIYRWREHVGPNEDYDDGYRTRDELENWQKKDQIPLLGEMLAKTDRERIDGEIEEALIAAFAFAENSPFPAPEEISNDVFAK
jgi:pyruvate dehydrogenase E1 component alpha subunit